MKRNDNYSSKPRIVRYTVVTCCHCGEKTIYARQWLTMDGWAVDRVTRKWMCPVCTGRFDRYADNYCDNYDDNYDAEEAFSGTAERT
jgi:hypothetical protein